jgi:chromate transporter
LSILFFSGLKPAIVAIVLTALLKISKKSLTDYFNIAIAVSSFTAIYFFHIEFPVIIISTILISLIKSFFFDKNSDTNSVDDIVTETGGKFKPLKILTGLAVFFILWIIPFSMHKISLK